MQREQNREKQMERRTEKGRGRIERVGLGGRWERKGANQRRGERRGKKKPAPEQKERKGERHFQTREVREEETVPAHL